MSDRSLRGFAALVLALWACDGKEVESRQAHPTERGPAVDAAIGAERDSGEPLQDAGPALPANDLFGNDALGTAYDASRSLPADFAALETWLQLGRACTDPVTKRIYVIEERQTRPDGVVVATSEVVPRVVIAGCAGGPLSRAEVMVALISDAHSDSDPLRVEHVELIALDAVTGLFNFYQFFFDAPTRVERVLVLPNGQVEERLWDGEKYTSKFDTSRQCFACHVNGGPIMNELSSPWLGWVSEARAQPLRAYTGVSAELVREADLSDDGRGSLAYDLERGVRAGIERFVSGAGDAAPGFARSVADGQLPGGAQRLLASVFCETELNYQPFPLALLVDPQATDGANVTAPRAPAAAALPRLIPTRSHFDRVVEQWLVGQGYLRPETVLAVRLFDHQHDIFSERRCALLNALQASLPKNPSALDQQVCDLLLAEMGAFAPSPHRAYATSLCSPESSDETRAQLRALHQASVVDELVRMKQSLTTDAGRQQIEQRAGKRVERAQALFPGAATPLPSFVR